MSVTTDAAKRLRRARPVASYAYRVLSHASILVNVICGGADYQTVSARMHGLRLAGWGWPADIIDTVAYLLGDGGSHCQRAYHAWQDRRGPEA